MRSNRRLRTAAILVTALFGVAAISCGRNDNTNNANNTPGSGGSSPSGATPPSGPGFDGTTITVGAITPQTGSAALIGNPLTAGNQLYFDAINAKGGIAGKYKVKMQVADSKYQTQDAVQQYGATKANVAMYVQVLGTAIVNAIKAQLGADGLYAGPATLDAYWVHEPNLMPIGGPYQIQMINGIDYAVRKLDAKGKKLCALTQDDPFGEAGMAGIQYGADKSGLKVETHATFKNGDKDFTAQINQLSSAGCEIVGLVSLPTETSGILSKAAGTGFKPQWIGQSPTLVSALIVGSEGQPTPLAPYLQSNYTLMAEGPQWGDTSVPGMKQMVDDVAQFAPTQKPDIYFAFGYTQAWAAAQILEQAVKDGDLSPKGIVAASTKVEKLTFGQLSGDYTYGNPEDRNPPRQSTAFVPDPTVPGYLKAAEQNFTSEAAKSYEIESP
jgi:ABC-type branched-subunit amino acid transport system substrate-binding protein